MRTIPASLLRHRPRHLRLIPPEPRTLPFTRAECVNEPRPCPHISCRHHLGIDVSHAGGIMLHFLDDPDEMRETCSLDVAEAPRSCAEVAEILGVSRERVRQIEARAIKKLDGLLGEWRER